MKVLSGSRMPRKVRPMYLGSFLKGMGSSFGIAIHHPVRVSHSWQDGLKHDSAHLWDDLVEALSKLISELPHEQRQKLKNFILEYDDKKLLDWKVMYSENPFTDVIGLLKAMEAHEDGART